MSTPAIVDRPCAVVVPSLTATDVQPQYATASGGPFATLTRADGSGGPFTVYSGPSPAVGILTPVATPFVRLTTITPQDGVRSFTLVPVR